MDGKSVLKRLLIASCLFSSFSGCTYGIYAVPDGLKSEMDTTLSFEEVIKNPKAGIGKKVLWGGTIVKTTVSQEGTLLEILQKPLNEQKRPLSTDESMGRFLVERVSFFLDPAIYGIGRNVTIVGEIREERSGQIGEVSYRYPYVVASHIHLWQARFLHGRNFYSPYPFLYGPPYYFYSCYDPYWYCPFGPPPIHRRHFR